MLSWRIATWGAALIVMIIIGVATSGWGMRAPSPDSRAIQWMGSGHMPGAMPSMGGGHHPGTGTAPAPLAGAPTVPVVLADFKFRPVEIRIQAGRAVNLAVTNRGAIEHDLTIPTLGIHAVAPVVVGLAAPRKGTYALYCSVPGHREAGMVGRLIVVP